MHKRNLLFAMIVATVIPMASPMTLLGGILKKRENVDRVTGQ